MTTFRDIRTPSKCEPDLETMKELLVRMGEERNLDVLLDQISDTIIDCPDTAMVRLWLVDKGDQCVTCSMRDACPARLANPDGEAPDCLHLVASRGRSKQPSALDLDRCEGRYSRFPIGPGNLGEAVMTGEIVDLPQLDEGCCAPIADPVWIKAEGITSFVALPLRFLGDTLGVLAVFSRAPAGEGRRFWLQMIADHAAAAISTARAFEQIDQLKRSLELENEYLREEARGAAEHGDIIGGSAALGGVLDRIELVAPTEATVLVLGESGTGKELVSREIHKFSARADKPLVRVNCASVPRELYESEFFGHVQGAFTGALKDRAGRFELADGGTLLLDEVGEIPLGVQAALLRVLQEGQYERVGDDRTRQVDVRVIAATNRDLADEVRAGRFREDLYYRLNVFPIEIAPLRERPDDIPVLVQTFLARGARKLGRDVPVLTRGLVQQLEAYSWPGNVRELQNVVERALITSAGGKLSFDLPRNEEAPRLRSASAAVAPVPNMILTDRDMRDRDRQNLRAALDATDWRIYGPDGAAELLEMKPTTLASRMKKYGLAKQKV
ncbi:MAG: transcriptional regulator with GAF, ATPase, and Fis domain [Planctomycetota bacterium]|jgi:transcriptional regulator with GAF, ATPase, and Fis domain